MRGTKYEAMPEPDSTSLIRTVAVVQRNNRAVTYEPITQNSTASETSQRL